MWNRTLIVVATIAVLGGAVVVTSITQPDSLTLGIGESVPQAVAGTVIPSLDPWSAIGLQLLDGAEADGHEPSTTAIVLPPVPRIDPVTGLIVAEPVSSLSAEPPPPAGPPGDGGSTIGEPSSTVSPVPPANETPAPNPTPGDEPSPTQAPDPPDPGPTQGPDPTDAPTPDPEPTTDPEPDPTDVPVPTVDPPVDPSPTDVPTIDPPPVDPPGTGATGPSQ